LAGLSASVLPLLPYVPESPRFLVVQGRTEECVQVIARVAQANGSPLSEGKLGDLSRQLLMAKEQQELRLLDVPRRAVRSEGSAAICFENARRLCTAGRTTVLLALVWFSSNFGFYSFATWAPTLMKESIGGSATYLIITSTTFLQFVSLWAAIRINRRLGPFKVLVIYLTINATAVFSFALVDKPSTLESFAFYGAFNYGTAGYFALLYLVTNISYPTEVRTTAFGLCAAMGRFGGILAPVLGGWLYSTFSNQSCHFFAAAFALAALATLLLVSVRPSTS
jgi:putative MFS transporter